MKQIAYGTVVLIVLSVGGPRAAHTLHTCGRTTVRGMPGTADTRIAEPQSVARAVGAVDRDSAEVRFEAADLAREDDTIRRRVNSALLSAPGLQARQIDVEVQGRAVRLSGVVSNIDQERRAVAIVRGMDGIKDVRSWIQVQ